MKSDRPLFAVLISLTLISGSLTGTFPTAQAGPPADDGWDFSYSDKDRGRKGRLDLHFLNEAEAGQSGFVRLSGDGNSFVLGDGMPVKFWAIGSELFRGKPQEDLVQHVKFLARMGVNMVRLHAQLSGIGPNSKLTDVNEAEIDGIWRFVAAAKEEGIYTTISPYWAQSVTPNSWGIEGHASGGALWGLLFFDETLQRGYKAWAAALYTRPNPYTNIPLAKDPAVALIQIQNEDSLFFWTTGAIKPAQQLRFERLFSARLIEKYGSLDGALKAWGGAAHQNDDLAGGKLGLVDMYNMTIPQPEGMGRRVTDQVAFFAETQHKFYGDMKKFYRETLGCGQIVNASNWRTANQTLLDDSERWSYSATDVIAVNRYYNGGVHLGPNVGQRIDPGDKFSQRSALLNPRELPTNLKQVVGHPMMITESSWVSPLAFQSEGPFLTAVYESLTGVDGFFWFTANAIDYLPTPFFQFQINGQQPLEKWSASIPSILGGFPATALLFRSGYVKQGEPVVHEERALQSLWERQTPLIAEDPSFDPNRDQSNPTAPRPGEKSTAVDPLAFLVGPVEVKYGGDPTKTRVADLSRYIDQEKKKVRSITGEVTLDYNIGLCTVDAPKAQGACGFLAKAGLIKLTDVLIRSSNAYATILAVPLDDLPIATSKRILVQVGTAARPTGWQTKEVEFQDQDKKPYRGYEIVNTGRPPWRIADAEIGLSIKNTGLTKATLLDTAGYPAENIPVNKVKSGLTIVLPNDTMYLILE